MKAAKWIVLMLVIMGQRWDLMYYQFVVHKLCNQDVTPECSATGMTEEAHYQLVYVIGESVATGAHPMMCNMLSPCWKIEERFTIPVPKTLNKRMTNEEADKLNRDLDPTIVWHGRKLR